MGIFKTLTGLFSGKNKEDTTPAETSRKLRDFLQNQIDTLGREGHHVHINEITVGYISHLIMLITNKPVNFTDAQQIMTSVFFTDKTSLIMINNAFQIFSEDVQTEEKLAALFPIAKKEYEAGSGEFLIRHTRQAKKAIEALFSNSEHYDPRNVPRWTANNLA